MSPEDYTNAVDYVAAQLTPDQFATYIERIALLAQGYEYRLKCNVGKGNTPVVYVDADLDKRGRLMVTRPRRALVSKYGGDTNSLYNATAAQARGIQFKYHPSCKQLPMSEPGGPASKSEVQFKLPPKPPPASAPSGSASESEPSKGQRKQARAKAKLTQVEDSTLQAATSDAAALNWFRELKQKAKGAGAPKGAADQTDQMSVLSALTFALRDIPLAGHFITFSLCLSVARIDTPPLHPAALSFVSYGILLVRVRVRCSR